MIRTERDIELEQHYADDWPAQAPTTPLDRLRAGLLDLEGLRSLPPPTWLIRGVLAADSLALLYGKPGSSKSFVALDWSLCVATGTWWHRHAIDQRPVLYVASEGASGLAQRADAWLDHQRIYDTPPISWETETVSLLDPVDTAALAAIAVELDAGLVVIDTLARSMPGGDENAARDMGLAIHNADTIRRATGACVVLVHHDTKEGGTPRGSSALLGAVNTAIACSSDDRTVTLRNAPPHGKQKDAAEFEPIRLGRVDHLESCVIVDHPPLDANMPDTAVEMLRALDEIADEDGVSRTRWNVATGVATRSFDRWVKRLVEADFVAKSGKGNQVRFTLTEQGERHVH
jgi:predicted transcriptional regulator